ncbi:MAG: hypothetical protein GY846_24105, partial [Deltaproteobacteria bacterium]|nr:hypothetical protein [Deltaproteobacteria bacterium]
MSRYTGVASDISKSIFENEPALLEKLGKAVFMAQVVDNLLEAKDTEAMAAIFNQYVGQTVDFFAERTLHPALLSFLGAVKIYKTSLELVRDYIVIPKLNNNIYARYKAARNSNTASPGEAFDEAIYTYLSGYHMVKDTWYQKMIKTKGYNAELVGDRLEKHLRRKLDRFWINRLEEKYQQQRLVQSKKAMV